MAARPCPCGCGQSVNAGKLLALTCWRRVPRALQQDVNRTWRVYQRVPTVASFRAYRAARDEAVRVAEATRPGSPA